MNKFIFVAVLLIISQYTQAASSGHIDPLHRTLNRAMTKYDNDPHNESTSKKVENVLTTLSSIATTISVSHGRIAKIISDKVAKLKNVPLKDYDAQKDVTKVEANIRKAINNGQQRYLDLFKTIDSVLKRVSSPEELKKKMKEIQERGTEVYIKAITATTQKKGLSALQRSYSTFIKTLTNATERKLRNYITN